MIASSTSASTATGGFYASFRVAMPAPEPLCTPPYSHNCAGYYSSRGLGKTMVLSAFIVVLLIGASYRGDPSADGPARGPCEEERADHQLRAVGRSWRYQQAQQAHIHH